jgi:hypothetical protein
MYRERCWREIRYRGENLVENSVNEGYREGYRERRLEIALTIRLSPTVVLCILYLQNSLQDSLLYISFLSNNVLSISFTIH